MNSRLMQHIDMNPETHTKLVENFIKRCVCMYTTLKKKKKINSALHLVWRLVFRNCSLFVNCCFDYTEFLIPSGKDLRHLTCISALRAGEVRVVNEVSLHRKESCHRGPFRMLE